MPRRARLLAFVAPFLFVPPVSAQQPESIPRELAAALVSARPGDDVVFHVDEAPPGLVAVWPDGSRILGGIEDVRDGKTVVVVVPMPPDEAEAAIVGALEAASWKRAPEWNPGGGFTSTHELPIELCRGERRWGILVGNHPEGALVEIHDAPAGGSRCETDPPGYGGPYGGVLPSLRVPERGRFLRGGGGSSGATVYSTARFESDLEIEALLDHFGALLEQAGWTGRTRDLAGSVGVSTWSFEYNGEPWEGFFVVATNARNQARYLSITAWDPERVH